jgi:hypothetical protein
MCFCTMRAVESAQTEQQHSSYLPHALSALKTGLIRLSISLPRSGTTPTRLFFFFFFFFFVCVCFNKPVEVQGEERTQIPEERVLQIGDHVDGEPKVQKGCEVVEDTRGELG